MPDIKMKHLTPVTVTVSLDEKGGRTVATFSGLLPELAPPRWPCDGSAVVLVATTDLVELETTKARALIDVEIAQNTTASMVRRVEASNAAHAKQAVRIDAIFSDVQNARRPLDQELGTDEDTSFGRLVNGAVERIARLQREVSSARASAQEERKLFNDVAVTLVRHGVVPQGRSAAACVEQLANERNEARSLATIRQVEANTAHDSYTRLLLEATAAKAVLARAMPHLSPDKHPLDVMASALVSLLLNEQRAGLAANSELSEWRTGVRRYHHVETEAPVNLRAQGPGEAPQATVSRIDGKQDARCTCCGLIHGDEDIRSGKWPSADVSRLAVVYGRGIRRPVEEAELAAWRALVQPLEEMEHVARRWNLFDVGSTTHWLTQTAVALVGRLIHAERLENSLAECVKQRNKAEATLKVERVHDTRRLVEVLVEARKSVTDALGLAKSTCKDCETRFVSLDEAGSCGACAPAF